MIFRRNPDGSEFEVLKHNFRNNYEVAADSFGNVGQSDNDDDGHYGVRINYILEGGNYGTARTHQAGWQHRVPGGGRQLTALAPERPRRGAQLCPDRCRLPDRYHRLRG